MPSHSALRSLTIRSYPKVNLALDILGKDPSGYHRVQTVLHELVGPLCDELIFEPREDGKIVVEADHPKLPTDETNTVWKAAMLLKKQASKPSGARIFIKKRIPLMSGLGGGASNGAAALKGLAELWEVECCARSSSGDHDAHCLLLRLASQIGMDCPFYINGGTALGEHFGEKISPLPSLPPSLQFEIIDTGVEISSRWAYENIILAKCGKNTGKTQELIAALHAHDARNLLQNLHNDFEELIFKKHPKLTIKKKALAPAGLALLAGSGGALVLIHRTVGAP